MMGDASDRSPGPRWLPWVCLGLLALPFHPLWVDFEQVRRGLLLVLVGALLCALPRLPRWLPSPCRFPAFAGRPLPCGFPAFPGLPREFPAFPGLPREFPDDRLPFRAALALKHCAQYLA